MCSSFFIYEAFHASEFLGGVKYMMNYYVALQSKSHAFILEQRMRQQGVQCELVYMPRAIMKDLCNMGVRFDERYFKGARNVINSSGLPDCKVYIETVYPNSNQFSEISLQ